MGSGDTETVREAATNWCNGWSLRAVYNGVVGAASHCFIYQLKCVPLKSAVRLSGRAPLQNCKIILKYRDAVDRLFISGLPGFKIFTDFLRIFLRIFKLPSSNGSFSRRIRCSRPSSLAKLQDNLEIQRCSRPAFYFRTPRI